MHVNDIPGFNPIKGVVFGCVCSVIAEKHQIPFATIWASGVPHPSVYKEGQRMNTSPSWLPFFIPSDDTPDVIVKALGALHLAFLVTLNTISTSNELKLFNSLRSDLGLPPMNNFVHLMGLYPAIAHAGLILRLYFSTQSKESLYKLFRNHLLY